MTKDTALVVPSIRKESFDRFVSEWSKTGLFDRVDLILVEDNPTKTFSSNYAYKHFCWEDIESFLGVNSSIIPRRSDTVRSFGYWWVYNSQNYEYLMTLDDDCYPAEGYENIDLIHKSFLTRTKWFNTLNNVRPRGVPYKNLGERHVYVNHGIWQGVLDYDAPQQLVNPVPEVYSHDNRIVPNGAYFPFCGMNVMWRRDAILLSYHLLMGNTFIDGKLNKLFVDRFGDIWCGIIQKKICDYSNMAISTGTPYIHHDRASNPFTNLRKEANGIEINEWFWERIDGIDLSSCDPYNINEQYVEIALSIKLFGGEHAEYWKQLGEAMCKWATLF